MHSFPSIKTWSALAVAVAAAVVAVAPAQAKVYAGNWDPNYGGLFSQLGWRGSVEVSAPKACNGLTGSFANGDSPCGAGEMTILSATVQFYDVSDPTSVLQTLNFDAGSTSIYGMTLQFVGPAPRNTDLKGLDTGWFAPIKGTTSQARYMGNDYYWHLGFTGDKALLAYTHHEGTSPLCAYSGNSAHCGIQDYVNYPTTVTFVPEPETYAMMLAGIGAIGFFARRRRAAAQSAASASA